MVGPLSPRLGPCGDRVLFMTDTRELDVINEALTVIDKALGQMAHRELVSSDEVSDLLLDVRTLLVTQAKN